MFGPKKGEDAPPSLLEREGRALSHLNKEAYEWLGPRYEWFNKIRTAKKGGMKLFQDASLEEQMEATRSALTLVTRTLNTALVMAYNSVIDSVNNSGNAPEGWLSKLEGDRSVPPQLSFEQDAVIIGWMPLKFLNLAKPVRDKGKGLEFYGDGLIKKLYFKVIGFYADPRNWAPERIGYFFPSLAPDATLQEVQGKLAVLKAEVDQSLLSLQLFKFGKASRRKEAGQKNAIEETFEITDKELLNDLYFQGFLLSGLEHFIFRYYLTLLSVTRNTRALKQISQIIHPLLAKVVELHIRFQSSFATEREKVRLRKDFMEVYKQRESRPAVETVTENGREFKRINYNHRLLESQAFSRAPTLGPRQAQLWGAYLNREVVAQAGDPRGYALLLEVLNTLVWDTQCAMEGKLKAAVALREFADEQEKLGKLQLAQKKKALDEAKRDKAKAMAKFRAQEQANMVEVLQKELAELETGGVTQLEQMDQAIAKRREAMIARVDQLEAAAHQDRETNLGKSAASVYALIEGLDPERKFRSGLVGFLVQHIREDRDDYCNTLYKNLFNIVSDLAPTEKMLLRSAVAQKMPLEESDLAISEEEQRTYQEQILSRKTELNMEVPGIMEQRLAQGSVPARIEQLLAMGLTIPSLRLLFTLPFSAANKPAGKLPGEVVKKLLMLNQLANPLPENDLTLPNVEENAPAVKRINFNRLQKLMA